MRDRSPLRARKYVGPWLSKLEMRAKADHLSGRLGIPRGAQDPDKPVNDGLVLLAALLSIVGDLEDEEAKRSFFIFKELLFHERRIGRWVPALKKIPPERSSVLHISEGLYTYYQITGNSLRSGRVDPVQVIVALLEIKDPPTYIRHLHGRGLSALGAMFHPNTLERAKGELRGVFGNTGEYWKKTAPRVRIIDDG